MNRPLVDGRTFGMRFAKPFRVEADIDSFVPTTGWIAVREKLEREPSAALAAVGFQFLNKGNATVGEIVAVGPWAENDGLKKGDRIVYTEWQGGRWSFRGGEVDDVRVLIMSVDDVLCIVEEE